MAFATGKVAVRKEREAVAAQREARTTLSKQPSMGSMSVNVEDKYKYMIAPTIVKKESSSDDAWDD